jgi:hypothetical protein
LAGRVLAGWVAACRFGIGGQAQAEAADLRRQILQPWPPAGKAAAVQDATLAAQAAASGRPVRRLADRQFQQARC